MAGRGKMLGSISVKQWMMSNSRTDIQFPASQIAQFLKKILQYPVDIGTLIYLASILEGLSAEVLELVGNAARDNKKSKIVPQRMQVTVRNDEELMRLLGRVIIDKRCDAQNS